MTWDQTATDEGGDGWHRYHEDGIAAGTETALNVASIFVGGGLGAGAKATSTAGKVGAAGNKGSRASKFKNAGIVAADLAVPGGGFLVSKGFRAFEMPDAPTVNPTAIGDDLADTAPARPNASDDKTSHSTSEAPATDRESTAHESGAPNDPGSTHGDGPSENTPTPLGDKPASDKHDTSSGRPSSGTRPTTSHPGTYDPDAPPRETVPAKDNGRRYKPADVQHALDSAPQNEWGQPVDHRSGRPLLPENVNGDRGWIMRQDAETGEWVAENRGLHENGLPAKGEPGSFGYDDNGNGNGNGNGNLRPYANHRPDYAPGQVERVWERTRANQMTLIDHGILQLEKPKADNQMWVCLKEDATDPYLVNLGEDGKWKLIEWNPGEPRGGIWDMGHIATEPYAKIRDKYLKGGSLEDVLEDFQDITNYEVPEPARNRSHVDEIPHREGEN